MEEVLAQDHYVASELDHLYEQRGADIDRSDSLDDDDLEQFALIERIDAAGKRIRRLKMLKSKAAIRDVRNREADRLWALRRGDAVDWDPSIEFRPAPIVIDEWWLEPVDPEWAEKQLPRQKRELDRLVRLEKKGELAAEIERLMEEARDEMKWSLFERMRVYQQVARIEHGGSFWEFPPELRPGMLMKDMPPYLRGLLLMQRPDAAPDELWDSDEGIWYRVGRLTKTEVAEVVTADRPRFRLYSVEELDLFPEVEWFDGLDGYVARRELTVVFGHGGSKKSFTVLDWAAHIAAQRQTVLYVAAEGASGLQGRIAAWKSEHRIDRLDHLKVMPAPIHMQEGKDVGAFTEAVEMQLGEHTPVLVVIDTLGRNFVGGDENSAKDMGLFVEGAEWIRRRWDTAVIVVHHTTKDGRAERGSEALRNASFAMFKFTSSGMSVTVECDRIKDAAEPQPVKMQMVAVDLGDDRTSLVAPWPFGVVPEPVSASEQWANADTRDAEREQRIAADIKHYLERESMSDDPYCSQTQVAKNVKGTDSTVIKVLKELALDPRSPVQIEKDGKTVRYYHEDPSDDE